MGTTVFERQRPAASAIAHSLAQTRQSVFWLDDLPEAPTRPRVSAESTADLVVVGAGYTGLWTALQAKRRDPGRRVVVVEAKTVGWAASGRNGGFCEASLTHGRDNGLSRWPDEIDRLDELGIANLDGMGEDIARYGIDADWERTGSLGVATEPHQIEWLDEWAADAAARGDDAVKRLSQAEIQASIASPTYLGAVWETHATALVHPGKLAAGLARAAEEAGVEIFEGSPVHAIDEAGESVKVVTTHGRITAGRVALATNVFPSILKRNRLMTVPVYDYVLMTEPLSPAQLASIGWRNRQGIGDAGNQFHYYRLTADNRILWGGYDAVYYNGGRIDPAHDQRESTFAVLADHFAETFPQLSEVRFTHQWGGVIDTCSRFSSFFGTAYGGRLAYAVGYTGLGVGATRFGADVMLDLLYAEDTDRTRLRMVRERPMAFPPEPIRSAAIHLTRWSMSRADTHQGHRNLWLRTLDKLGLGFDF